MGLARLMCDEGYREKLGKQAKKDMIPYAPKNVWDQWEKLIRGLPAVQQTIIRMKDVEGYEIGEIAEITGSQGFHCYSANGTSTGPQASVY